MFHVEHGEQEAGVFHVELCGACQVRRMRCSEDGEADGGAGSRGQQGERAVALRFADEKGESSAGGDELGGGGEGLLEFLYGAHGDQGGAAGRATRRGR